MKSKGSRYSVSATVVMIDLVSDRAEPATLHGFHGIRANAEQTLPEPAVPPKP